MGGKGEGTGNGVPPVHPLFIMSFVYVGLSTRKFARQNLNNLYIFNGYSTEKTLVYLFENISL